jgi:DNA repair protein RadD
MKIRPRAYQAEAVQSIYSYFSSNTGNPLILMPTGTGKAVVIAIFLESIFQQYYNQKVMVLTHVKELVEQNYLKLKDLWPSAPAGIYSAGLNKREHDRSIIFAGIGSVAKRAAVFGRVDLIIIDEAHLVSTNEETQYRKFLNEMLEINPQIKVIGLTATGWRLGQGRITDGGIFTDVCYDITSMHAFNRLIDEGYLCPLIPKQTKLLLDTSGVHLRGGEFIASELQLAVDRDEITRVALSELVNLSEDRKHWLIFATGIQHAVNIADMLNTVFGIRAVAIHSKMSNKERDDAIKLFKSGYYTCAVNNGVLTTGFDFPAIDLIGVLRPTDSPGLWVQMLGRGTRPLYADGFDLDTIEGRLLAIQFSAKQNCLVLDFAANTKRLGPINDPVIPRKKGQGGGDAPVKICGSCGTYNHASVTHCICCGAEFTFVVKLKMESGTDTLIKDDNPIVELFKVDHITYSKHEKLGRPPMMKVSYYCGLRVFEEFVCVEHEGFAHRKARQFWTQRGEAGEAMPETTEFALVRAERLKAATHIKVWINKKYPEILSYCFDGTAFGEQASTGAAPSVKTVTPKPKFGTTDLTE